ncbi:unnamed protein product [Heterobilharzia americana]|nr:unnamed protein product [Heterobilharzia americana]
MTKSCSCVRYSFYCLISILGRGRKPAPPPPPKMNSTSESLLKHPNVDRFEAESRSTEVQNIKSSENLINFQENKKKESTCKVSTENRKLSQTLKGEYHLYTLR